MALPYPIAPTQTDAKSPIDQQLMDALRLNQEYIDSQLGAGSAGGIINFRVNGYLNRIKALLTQGAGKHIDGGIISNAVTFTQAKLYLENIGDSGALEVDVLRHKEVQHGIVSIDPAYSGAIQAIGRLGSPQNTQAISLATPTINTQSIARAKSTLNIISVSKIGSQTLYVFSGGGLLDEDYQIGKSIDISGCTNGANNGSFTITSVNYDGLASVMTNNAGGVTEVTAGNAELDLWEYTFLASVDPNFTVGEVVSMSGHTNPANDLNEAIHKVNNGGNNIWIYNGGGVAQAGVAGQAKANRFVYSYASAIDDTSYIVDELAEFSGHLDGNNNGQFKIVAVNDGGNNLVIYNTTWAGAIQGGAQGTANTLRWLYSMPTDPTGEILVGQTIVVTGASSGGNNGSFIVTTVNRFAIDNIEVYNPAGVTQVGAAGTLATNSKVITFAEDFSAFYVAGKSKVALEGVNLTDTDGREYDVIDVNKGGFSNYNVVIDEASGVSTNVTAQGRVSREVRTIFVDRPRIEIDTTISKRYLQKDLGATFEVGGVDSDTILSMDILEVPEGLPSNMVLSLA